MRWMRWFGQGKYNTLDVGALNGEVSSDGGDEDAVQKGDTVGFDGGGRCGGGLRPAFTS